MVPSIIWPVIVPGYYCSFSCLFRMSFKIGIIAESSQTYSWLIRLSCSNACSHFPTTCAIRSARARNSFSCSSASRACYYACYISYCCWRAWSSTFISSSSSKMFLDALLFCSAFKSISSRTLCFSLRSAWTFSSFLILSSVCGDQHYKITSE